MRQIVKAISIVTIAVTVLVGLTTAASAAPVLIVNAGFEAPSLVDSQAIFTRGRVGKLRGFGNVRSARGRPSVWRA